MSGPPPPSDNLGSILGGSGAAILSALGVLYTAVNHKHVKAKCCGKTFEAELDIGSTEAAAKAPKTQSTSKVHPDPDIEKGEASVDKE
jgi:hypothetical protein